MKEAMMMYTYSEQGNHWSLYIGCHIPEVT